MYIFQFLKNSNRNNLKTFKIYFIVLSYYIIYNVHIKDGTGRPRAGPENPGPRSLRAETGLMIFYLRFLCALCAGRWVVTREMCCVLTIEQMYEGRYESFELYI